MSEHKKTEAKKDAKNDLVETIGEWFEKFPAIPKKGREVLVKFVPIIAVVFGILGIITSIGGLGLLTATSPLAVLGGADSVSSYGTGFVSVLIYLVSSVMLLAAFPGLKARKVTGWNLLFWSEIVSFVGGIVSLTSILSALISIIIGLYLVFQIRSYYK